MSFRAATQQRENGRKPRVLDAPGEDDRPITLVGQPVTLSRTPSRIAARPPDFGEQTADILTEFGFAADEIAGLKARNVV